MMSDVKKLGSSPDFTEQMLRDLEALPSDQQLAIEKWYLKYGANLHTKQSASRKELHRQFHRSFDAALDDLDQMTQRKIDLVRKETSSQIKDIWASNQDKGVMSFLTKKRRQQGIEDKASALKELCREKVTELEKQFAKKAGQIREDISSESADFEQGMTEEKKPMIRILKRACKTGKI